MKYPQNNRTQSEASNHPTDAPYILLVDSNHSRAVHTLQSLRKLDGSIQGRVVGNRKAAVLQARTVHFDCAIVQQSAAGEDGLWLINLLRDSQDLTPIPVVIIAEQAEYSDVVLALRAGAADFLSERTLTTAALLESVQSVVYRRVIEQAAEAQAYELERENLDLTRRQRSLAEAQGGMAHSLLTPLSAISEYLSLVLDGIAGDYTEEQGRFLAVARGRCAEIQTHVEQLVALGDKDVSPPTSEKPVLLESLIMDILDRFSLPAAVKGVHFGYAIDSGVRYVQVDELLLKEAVIGLVYRLMATCIPSGSILLLAEIDKDSPNQVRMVLRAQVNLLPEQVDELSADDLDDPLQTAALRYLADGMYLEQHVDNDLEFRISLPVAEGPALAPLSLEGRSHQTRNAL